MRRRILFISEEDSYSQLIKLTMESAGYEVVQATDFKMAEGFVTIYNNYSACILDIQMRVEEGKALLRYIMKCGPIPVILLCGQSDLKDEQEAKNLGAAKLLKKPFKKEELLILLGECFKEDISDLKPKITDKLNKTTEQALENQETEIIRKDEEFSRISIHDFISGKELQTDIYIRVDTDRYIKIANLGSAFTPENLIPYKAKNVDYLYVVKEDFKKYVEFSVSLSNIVTSSPTLPKSKKIQFIKHTTEIISTQLHLEGINQESFDNAKTVMNSSLAILSDSEEMLTMLNMLNSASDTTYSHSTGVSLYSTMLAKTVGMNSPLILFKVSVGGMLHDIGKKEIPADILGRPRHLLNAQEIKIYESHTTRGAEILGRFPFVQDDVIKIVAQHHENCLGTGYPANLKMQFIHPLARLVSVANEFCNLAIRSEINRPMPPKAALERMSLVYANTLDPVFFIALAKLFNFQLSTEYHEAQRRNRDKTNAKTSI